MDSSGNLFGTAAEGGANSGGAIFRLSGSKYTVLYNFCSKPQCVDGQSPRAGVTADPNGDLFGTTETGGIDFGNEGTVFELRERPR